MNTANAENILIADTYFNANARATNVLRHWHKYDSDKRPPLKTLGDIAKLSRFELLMVPNCGRKTLLDIEEALAEHGLSLKDTYKPTSKPEYVPLAYKARIKELEEKNDRLLMELGYLQGEYAKVEALKLRIVELENNLKSYEESERRAWNNYREAVEDRNITRAASMGAIRELQVELEKARGGNNAAV